MVDDPNDPKFTEHLELIKGDPGVKNLLISMFKIDLQKKYEDIIEEQDRCRVDVLRGQAGLLKWYIEKLGG